MTNTTTSTNINTVLKVRGGLESKHDFAMMHSAQRDEDAWKGVAAVLGLDSMPVMHPTTTTRSEDSKAPKATIKRNFKTLHASYAQDTKRNERMIKAFIYRLKLEDELDISPINNPYSLRDSIYSIKVTGFEYRKPYIVISAVRYSDEHERQMVTRSADETSEIYFTFNVAPIYNKFGKLVENPELTRLRKFLWNKVDHSKPKCTFQSMLQQMVGRVVNISVIDSSEDFLGYPSYDVSDLVDGYDRTTCDHVGSFSNLPKHSFKSATNGQLVANA